MWQSSALSQLANLWTQAADQQAIADASNRIDRVLGNQPIQVGTRLGRFFTYSDSPSAVPYHLEPRDRMAWVV
jgi:hypothetical protein